MATARRARVDPAASKRPVVVRAVAGRHRHGREPAQVVNFIGLRQAAGQTTENKYSTAAE